MAKAPRITEIPESLTFDDVLLRPGPSEVLPNQVNTATQLTQEITLNIPILSSAMIRKPKARWRLPWLRLVAWGYCIET